MESIYFDYNVISYLRTNEFEDLSRKFSDIKDSKVIHFSPAHLEEIAVSAIRDKVSNDIVSAELNFLTEIAKNNALRPVTRKKLAKYSEYPIDCYKRVLQGYKGNDLAEAIDKQVIDDAHDNPAGQPREQNNVEPEEVLNKFVVKEMLAFSLFRQNYIKREQMVDVFSWSFDDIKNDFDIFEAYTNLASNYMEKIGYNREKRKKSRSRLHDVSHIIYAAYTDVFVCGDKKLRNKAKAIYSSLNIRTQVMSVDEFVASGI
ncbi:hypothetical protein [Vibrio parahaemolyticus]|uniref:hypothetical protein n=1 Tax=Vibrio parahaemolyticus TaxID=670 RepID=UPI0009AB9623|nr:hypothetical protein [Vibrio parahaemolyticus]